MKKIYYLILISLIYNSYDDLVHKYSCEKHNLSEEALELLLFGDDLLLNSKYRTISGLEYRWCLKSILDYHLNMTYKISRKQYDNFFGL